MEQIMIVSSHQKFAVTISELINSLFSPQITIQKSENEARRALSQREYDLVIINTPLSDEFGHELALQIAQDSMSGVMLLVAAGVEGRAGFFSPFSTRRNGIDLRSLRDAKAL